VDDEEFETIRRWAAGLQATDRREEVRAAAKAILLLADEVERLRVEIWHERLAVETQPPQPAYHDQEGPRSDDDAALYGRLRGRLTGLGRILPHRHVQP